ncbi:MAG: S-adenosylmethionine:tRNA ribosyltransferase-isomerase [Labilithrix sp.]|nr:S-adenosylmethionine:tRNA ribosyltransferase-isomerase [Labilithrix sp.]
MKSATEPRAARDIRILVVDAERPTSRIVSAGTLPELLDPGDVVVVNDAATLPASLQARSASGEALEIRLAGALDGSLRFTAALLGEGDHRTRTEDRPPPPRVVAGDRLRVGDELVARVLAVASFSRRLVRIELELAGEPDAHGASIWAALYRAGRPVQYAHVPAPLALWDVQNVWAARPWAVEMPSAGRAVRIETLLALRKRGVDVAFVTHAAGLSATGDPEIDGRLPLPERFEVEEGAVRAVLRAKARGGRVLAVGTSVARALESAARVAGNGPLHAACGVTDLLLGPTTARALVDGILTGVHESDTTHFTLLGSFAERAVLDDALATSEATGLLGHELGDAWLVWGKPATSTVAREREHAGCASATCAASATVAA